MTRHHCYRHHHFLSLFILSVLPEDRSAVCETVITRNVEDYLKKKKKCHKMASILYEAVPGQSLNETDHLFFSCIYKALVSGS